MTSIRALLMSILFVLPMPMSAHSWLDDAPMLETSDIDGVLEVVRAIAFNDYISKPGRALPIDVFEEFALRADEDDGTLLRTLLMFDAIRTGAIGENGEPNAEYLFNYSSRTYLKDRRAIFERYDDLDLWFKQTFEGE